MKVLVVDERCSICNGKGMVAERYFKWDHENKYPERSLCPCVRAVELVAEAQVRVMSGYSERYVNGDRELTGIDYQDVAAHYQLVEKP